MKTKKKTKKEKEDLKKEDFILDEKELDKVSGGSESACGEIGFGNPNCTKTGNSSTCTEIGVMNLNCTRPGV